MMDADEEENFIFTPGTRITLDLSATHPLSIFTVGAEIDGCGRRAFPDIGIVRLTGDLTLEQFFQNPSLNWFHAVEEFQGFADDWINCYALSGWNDVLGSINKFYEPPGYGAGQHVDVVSNGDFTLRYTIGVQPLAGGVLR